MSEFKDLVDEMVLKSVYGTAVEMPIPLYEKIKKALTIAENMQNTNLHELEFIKGGDFTRFKVEGGWIYTIYRLDSGQMNSVFVPEPPKGNE